MRTRRDTCPDTRCKGRVAARADSRPDGKKQRGNRGYLGFWYARLEKNVKRDTTPRRHVKRTPPSYGGRRRGEVSPGRVSNLGAGGGRVVPVARVSRHIFRGRCRPCRLEFRLWGDCARREAARAVTRLRSADRQWFVSVVPASPPRFIGAAQVRRAD